MANVSMSGYPLSSQMGSWRVPFSLSRHHPCGLIIMAASAPATLGRREQAEYLPQPRCIRVRVCVCVCCLDHPPLFPEPFAVPMRLHDVQVV